MLTSELVMAIQLLCEEYHCYLKDFGNECAYTDRVVEQIIEKASELKIRYDEEI